MQKKAPVKVEGNLMFTQRDNPYCDLLRSKGNKKENTKSSKKLKANHNSPTKFIMETKQCFRRRKDNLNGIYFSAALCKRLYNKQSMGIAPHILGLKDRFPTVRRTLQSKYSS